MVKMLKRAVSRYSKGIVLLCVAVTTLYTAAVMVLAYMTLQFPPPELTAGVFAMYSIEFGALAVIKVKDREQEEDDDGEVEEP